MTDRSEKKSQEFQTFGKIAPKTRVSPIVENKELLGKVENVKRAGAPKKKEVLQRTSITISKDNFAFSEDVGFYLKRAGGLNISPQRSAVLNHLLSILREEFEESGNSSSLFKKLISRL
jgi:hypothetical protein